MQLTIVPSDKQIIKDGIGVKEIQQDLSWIPSNVHAVHWDDTSGEIEYTDKDNEVISEIGIYSQAVTDHANEIKRLEDLEAAIPWTDLFKQRRNDLLLCCDWTQGTDAPITAEKKEEWKVYRQKLRDLPANITANPKDLFKSPVHSEWPTQPT